MNKRVFVMGVDPGATGAFVVLKADRCPSFYCLGDGPKNDADWQGSILLIRELRPRLAVLERQQYMSRDGRREGGKSAFSLGENYGMWLGALAALGVETVTVPPSAWQKYVYNGGATGDPKERSLRRARELFPKLPLIPHGCRTPRHGRSDAALIALYGVGILAKRGIIDARSEAGNEEDEPTQ